MVDRKMTLKELAEKGCFTLPQIPGYATNNAHMFYVVCRSLEERSALIRHLKDNGILAVFHYLSLHKSEYYTHHSDVIPELPECDRYADCLVRLPMYFELNHYDIDKIIDKIRGYFGE